MAESKLPITYQDFMRLDIRVGTVVEASTPEWSQKLLKLTVDFGPFGRRTIFSGVKKWYAQEEFIGNQYCFLVNLEPKTMGEELSEGMMLMADATDGDDGKPVLMPLTVKVENGTVVR